jgi:hypothetical protein
MTRSSAPAGDLELEYMKKTYGEAFQRAFAVALAAMPADDRLLLKQRFRHQLTVDPANDPERARDHAVIGRRGAARARQAVVRLPDPEWNITMDVR